MDREGDIDGNQWGDISDADDKHLDYLTGPRNQIPEEEGGDSQVSPDTEPASKLKAELEKLNAPKMALFTRLMSARAPAHQPVTSRDA